MQVCSLVTALRFAWESRGTDNGIMNFRSGPTLVRLGPFGQNVNRPLPSFHRQWVEIDSLPSGDRVSSYPNPFFPPSYFAVLKRFSLDNGKFCRVRCTVTKFVGYSARSSR
jgi:hypothetical protein